MKSLPIVLLAGWLYAAGSGTPVVLANDLKVADIDSCSQAGENSPSDDSAEAASTAQVSESASTSNNPGGASDLFWKWFRMGERIQADEPDWLSPLATTSGRLKQEFRYDVWRQPGTAGDTDYNFGAGKGIEFILAPRTQLMVGPPPYIAHQGGRTTDGYADIPVMLKVGLVAAGLAAGNAVIVKKILRIQMKKTDFW